MIFDFDGFLVESTEIKIEAFRKIFSKWPDKAEKGVAYHLDHIKLSDSIKESFLRG